MVLFLRSIKSFRYIPENESIGYILGWNMYNATTSRPDLRKYMPFKVVNKLNPIEAMKKLRNLTATFIQRNV